MEEEPRPIKVTYEFALPEHENELKIMQHASDYASALWDIHQKCRAIWKYEDDASDERVRFAEEIGDMVAATGVLEDFI